MGKVRRKLRDLPMLPTYIMLSIAFLLIAMLLVEIEKNAFSNAQSEIAFRYSDIVEGFNDEKVWGNQSVFLLSEQDSRKMWLYEMCLWILPTITYLACFFVWKFYSYPEPGKNYCGYRLFFNCPQSSESQRDFCHKESLKRRGMPPLRKRFRLKYDSFRQITGTSRNPVKGRLLFFHSHGKLITLKVRYS